MSATEIPLPRPSLTAGWAIFASRPLSLVLALILAVLVSVVSFGLLALPAVAAYYGAVRKSRRERFFIDLEVVLGTARDLLAAIPRFLGQGFLVGIPGLLLPIGLMLAPALILERLGPESFYLAVALQVVLVPAFFVSGSVVLFAYPHLIESGGGLRSLRYAMAAGWRRPFLSLLVGALILFPITAFVFHLLMVLTYPLLAASAVAVTAQEGEPLIGRSPLRPVAALLGFALGYTAVILGGGTIIARTWGEAAVVPWVLACILLLVVGMHWLSGKIG